MLKSGPAKCVVAGFLVKTDQRIFFFLCVPGSEQGCYFYRLPRTGARPGPARLRPLSPRSTSILSGLSCQNILLSTQFDTCIGNRLVNKKSSIDAGCRPILGYVLIEYTLICTLIYPLLPLPGDCNKDSRSLLQSKKYTTSRSVQVYIKCNPLTVGPLP